MKQEIPVTERHISTTQMLDYQDQNYSYEVSAFLNKISLFTTTWFPLPIGLVDRKVSVVYVRQWGPLYRSVRNGVRYFYVTLFETFIFKRS